MIVYYNLSSDPPEHNTLACQRIVDRNTVVRVLHLAEEQFKFISAFWFTNGFTVKIISNMRIFIVPVGRDISNSVPGIKLILKIFFFIRKYISDLLWFANKAEWFLNFEFWILNIIMLIISSLLIFSPKCYLSNTNKLNNNPKYIFGNSAQT